MGKLYPTLALGAGWVSDPVEKLDYALSHFFEAEKDQSYIYYDQVADLQTIIAENHEDITSLVERLQEILNQFLNRVFDSADVEVYNWNEQTNNNSPNVEIRVNIKFTDDEKSYSVGRLLNYRDSKFIELIGVLNG